MTVEIPREPAKFLLIWIVSHGIVVGLVTATVFIQNPMFGIIVTLLGVCGLEYVILNKLVKKACQIALINSSFLVVGVILLGVILQVKDEVFVSFLFPLVLASLVWLLTRHYIANISWWILAMGFGLPISAILSSLIANRFDEYRGFYKSLSMWMIYIFVTGLSLITVYSAEGDTKQVYVTFDTDLSEQDSQNIKKAENKEHQTGQEMEVQENQKIKDKAAREARARKFNAVFSFLFGLAFDIYKAIEQDVKKDIERRKNLR